MDFFDLKGIVEALAAGLHPGVGTGHFAMLDFPDDSARGPEPSTVYMDGPCGAVYLDKPAEIAILTDEIISQGLN